MFLRYLSIEGKCKPGLDEAVPSVANWRLSSLPRFLEASDVARVIASFNTQTTLGARNLAIVLLLARLWLRAGDAVALRLNDIDWNQATIRVMGKGRREVLLPLTQEVGTANRSFRARAKPAIWNVFGHRASKPIRNPELTNRNRYHVMKRFLVDSAGCEAVHMLYGKNYRKSLPYRNLKKQNFDRGHDYWEFSKIFGRVILYKNLHGHLCWIARDNLQASSPPIFHKLQRESSLVTDNPKGGQHGKCL